MTSLAVVLSIAALSAVGLVMLIILTFRKNWRLRGKDLGRPGQIGYCSLLTIKDLSWGLLKGWLIAFGIYAIWYVFILDTLSFLKTVQVRHDFEAIEIATSLFVKF